MLAPFRKGLSPYIAGNLFTAPGAGNVDPIQAGKLAQPFVDLVSLNIDGADIWTNQSWGQAEADAWIALLLDQVDLHLASVGRSPVPYLIRIYVRITPDWMQAGLTIPDTATGIIHERDSVFGIDWLSAPLSIKLFRQTQHLPYSHTSAYQTYVRTIRDRVSHAIEAADPTRMRVQTFHFIGPCMSSNTMNTGANLGHPWPTDGSPDPWWNTGAFAGDSASNAWTYPKHIAAFQTFANEMASVPAYRHRYGVFNFSSVTTKLIDQQPILATLAGMHPEGHNAVIAKQEDMKVGVYNRNTRLFNSLHRANYRATIGGTGANATQWYVQNYDPHAWEAFAPFTLINGGLSSAYVDNTTPFPDGMPNPAFNFSELIQNLFFKTFTQDVGGVCSDRAYPLWYEPFASDLLESTMTDYPAYRHALTDISDLIKGELDIADIRTDVTGEFLRVANA